MKRILVFLSLTAFLAFSAPSHASRGKYQCSLRTLFLLVSAIGGGLGYWRIVEEPEESVNRVRGSYLLKFEDSEVAPARLRDTSRYITRHTDSLFVYESLQTIHTNHPDFFKDTRIPLDSQEKFLNFVSLHDMDDQATNSLGPKGWIERYLHPIADYRRREIDTVLQRYFLYLLAHYEERTDGLENTALAPSEFTGYLVVLKRQTETRNRLARGEEVYPSWHAAGIYLADLAQKDRKLQLKLLEEMVENGYPGTSWSVSKKDEGTFVFHHQLTLGTGNDRATEKGELRIEFTGPIEIYEQALEIRLEELVYKWAKNKGKPFIIMGTKHIVYDLPVKETVEAYVAELLKAQDER